MLKMVSKSFPIIVIILFFISSANVSLADGVSYGIVTGKVLDRNGTPIANASIQIQDYLSQTVNTTSSAGDGTFTFNKVPITNSNGNSFRLMATYYAGDNKSYSDKSEFFMVYQNQVISHDIEIFYYPPSGYGWLTGKVVNINNVNQHLSATIFLGNGMYSFVSGEQGDQYQFYLPEGDYQIWAEHNENGRTYGSGTSAVHVRSDDVYTAVLTVSLEGNGSAYHAPPAQGINIVHGNIVQKNNAPLYGAAMELCRLTGRSMIPVMSTASNLNGSFEFRNVIINAPAESYVVRATYNYNGADVVKISDPPFTIYYNNMLNVPHDHSVQMSVDFVDSGSLELVTDPPGAGIWIDGADSGRVTPFNFTGMKVGQHSVSLLLDGYMPENATVNVPAENTTRVTKQLKPSTGDVYFTVKPSDASVYLNGAYVGKGTASLPRLQYGQYAYEVSREGYRNVTGTFEVYPGGNLTIPVELVAVPGFSLTYLSYLIDSIIKAISSLF